MKKGKIINRTIFATEVARPMTDSMKNTLWIFGIWTFFIILFVPWFVEALKNPIQWIGLGPSLFFLTLIAYMKANQAYKRKTK